MSFGGLGLGGGGLDGSECRRFAAAPQADQDSGTQDQDNRKATHGTTPTALKVVLFGGAVAWTARSADALRLLRKPTKTAAHHTRDAQQHSTTRTAAHKGGGSDKPHSAAIRGGCCGWAVAATDQARHDTTQGIQDSTTRPGQRHTRRTAATSRIQPPFGAAGAAGRWRPPTRQANQNDRYLRPFSASRHKTKA